MLQICPHSSVTDADVCHSRITANDRHRTQARKIVSKTAHLTALSWDGESRRVKSSRTHPKRERMRTGGICTPPTTNVLLDGMINSARSNAVRTCLRGSANMSTIARHINTFVVGGVHIPPVRILSHHK